MAYKSDICILAALLYYHHYNLYYIWYNLHNQNMKQNINAHISSAALSILSGSGNGG